MKHILIGLALATQISIAKANECTDYSGTYSNHGTPQDETILQANQEDCGRITLDYIYNKTMHVSRNLILDGVQRLVFSSSEVLTYESAQRTQDGIRYQGIDEYRRENKKYFTEGSLTLDEQKNLIEKTEIYDEQRKLLKKTIQIFVRK